MDTGSTLLFKKDDADVVAEFSKEPMVVGCSDCVVGTCCAWGVPEYKDWNKLGLPDSIDGNIDSAGGEGSGVFNTPCPNCSVGEATYCSKGLVA